MTDTAMATEIRQTPDVVGRFFERETAPWRPRAEAAASSRRAWS